VCTIPTETGSNYARDIFFTICQPDGSIRRGGKPLDMLGHAQACADVCGHVRTCAGICEIDTCGSNII